SDLGRGPQARRDPFPGRARDAGLRPPRPDAAVGAALRRLQGPGARRGRGRTPARRSARSGRSRRRADRARGRARGAGRRHHPRQRGAHHRHRRGCRLRWPSAGDARHARPRLRPPAPEVREGFPGRGRLGGRCRGSVRGRRARRQLPRRGALLRMNAAIEVARALGALRARIDAWKREGLRVCLVPTMGNLHEGHYSLVRLARANADRVVASVFVNPTQFGPGEDYERYPRTPEADIAGLDATGCDLVWMPPLEEMYPLGTARAVRVQVPDITGVLDGAHRPGHFDGVCTVVARLFNQVQPDVAVFGRKDYQQLAVIRHMVDDLAFPVEVRGADIVREADGLAQSSRNQFLSPTERALAPEIHRTLLAMRAAVQGG